MYLSKSRKSGIWYIYYKRGGKKTRLSTHSRKKSESLIFLNDFEKKVKAKESKVEITLWELAQQYLKQVEITHTIESYKMTTKMVNYFLDYAGKQTFVSDVSKMMAESFILKTYSHAKYHAHLQLRHLKAFFNKAIEYNYITTNPFKGIKLSLPENHPAFINSNELSKILEKESDPVLQRLYKFAFYTGCRESEIINLEWSDINLVTKEIRVRNKNGYSPKSHRERMIPISQTVLEILNEQKKLSILIVIIFSIEVELSIR